MNPWPLSTSVPAAWRGRRWLPFGAGLRQVRLGPPPALRHAEGGEWTPNGFRSMPHPGKINSACRGNQLGTWVLRFGTQEKQLGTQVLPGATQERRPGLTHCCRNLKPWQQPTVRPRPPVARRGGRRVWRTRPCGTQERTCRRCAARGFRFFANFAPAFKSSAPPEGTAGRTQKWNPATRPATTVDNGVGTASEGFFQSCTPSTSIFMSV